METARVCHLESRRKIVLTNGQRINPTRKLFNRSVDLSNSMTIRYLLLFKLKIISGISHDSVANYPNTQSFTNTSKSLFFGFGLQFFDQGKDRFLLSFIYSQGTKEIVELDADYVNNGINYFGKIGSKGSFLTTQVSYPLRLITTLNRKKK